MAFFADSILEKPSTGVSIYAHHLVIEVSKIVDVTLIYTDLPFNNRYPEISSLAYRIWRFPFVKRRIRDRLLMCVLKRFDIFHDPSNYNIPLGRPRCPMVLTLHDVSAVEHPEFFQPWHLNAYREFLPKALKNVDGIITVSNLQKIKIAQHYKYPVERIFVVPLGIDSELFHPLERQAPISRPYLLYVGSIQPRKGLNELLKAFNLIKDRIPHTLCLVGGGWWGQEKEIKLLVDDLDLKERVIFTGTVSEEKLSAYYTNADLTILVTHNDSFGLPILESLACGTPVIASDIEGLRSAHPEGVLSFVEHRDPQAIAEAIIKLLEDTSLRLSFRDKGVRYASHRTWQQVAYETAAVYSAVLDLGHI